MGHKLNIKYIPGTVLESDKMGGVIGEEFLDKVYYITNGIMLSQIREITGIDGTTLQNWVKRKWVSNPKNKVYTKEQLARIMMIGMMRDTMQISRVAYLIAYVCGTDDIDKIISEVTLYDYICRIIVKISDPNSTGVNGLQVAIDEVLSEYVELVLGAKRRLGDALSVFAMTYYSALVKTYADDMLDALGADPKRRR